MNRLLASIQLGLLALVGCLVAWHFEHTGRLEADAVPKSEALPGRRLPFPSRGIRWKPRNRQGMAGHGVA
jgi:hypothetical protein